MHSKYLFKLKKIFRKRSYRNQGNIILHDKKIIYIPIPKIACTSIKRIFAKELGLEIGEQSVCGGKYDGKIRKSIHKEKFPFIKRSKIKKLRNDYTVFVVIRNPWDRILSCYKSKVLDGTMSEKYQNVPSCITKNSLESCILSKINESSKNVILDCYNLKDTGKYELKVGVYDEKLVFIDKIIYELGYQKGISSIFNSYGNIFWPGMSFESFIKAIASISENERDTHFRSQYTFMYYKDQMLANKIIKIKNMSVELPELFIDHDFSNQLEHVHRTKHKSYDQYYTNDTEAAVGEIYKKDIQLFSFKFNG